MLCLKSGFRKNPRLKYLFFSTCNGRVALKHTSAHIHTQTHICTSPTSLPKNKKTKLFHLMFCPQAVVTLLVWCFFFLFFFQSTTTITNCLSVESNPQCTCCKSDLNTFVQSGECMCVCWEGRGGRRGSNTALSDTSSQIHKIKL